MRVSPATEYALEAAALRSVLADFASSDLGRQAILALEPALASEVLTTRRQGYREVGELLPTAVVPRIDHELVPLVDRLGQPRLAPEGRELLALADLVDAVESVRSRIASIREAEHEEALPLLSSRLAKLPEGGSLVRLIRSRLDERGEVRDDATPELSRLKAGIRRRREQLYRELGDISRKHRDLLTEDTVPQRDGRLVLMLQSGARGRMDGLVHGRSATGRSFYFEPLAVVEGNNELQEASEEVQREKQRILEELRLAVAESLPMLEGQAELVAELDGWQAANRYAETASASLLEVAPSRVVRLREARHPLLDPSLGPARQRALGLAGHLEPVVPLDLELTENQRALVITGPNAGGKTVALKTLGLAAWAHACGLPVPAHPESALPGLSELVATVGDDQDLLADRSTFSGRLMRLKEVWDLASEESLILLDELGSGTDPEEGAALSAALLEALIERGSLVVVTTHLGQLAALAMERQGASCAAMEFDAARGAPRFRLVPGPPGGSEALALARRVGLAEELIEAAERRLGTEGRDYRRLIGEVAELRERLASDGEKLVSALASARDRERELQEGRDSLEEERRLVGKRARADLDRFRAEVRAQLSRAVEDLQEQWQSGRRKGLAREITNELLREPPEVAHPQIDEGGGEVAVGDRVRHRSLGWTGELLANHRGKAEVDIGGKRLRCRVEELVRAQAETRPSAEKRRPIATVPDSRPLPMQLNLIGQRVDPALRALERHLEEAVSQGLREVRIVHGHGTGRLRKAVRGALQGHPLVAGQRPAGANQGGDGATIAELA